jgi:hypothetical protein
MVRRMAHSCFSLYLDRLYNITRAGTEAQDALVELFIDMLPNTPKDEDRAADGDGLSSVS